MAMWKETSLNLHMHDNFGVKSYMKWDSRLACPTVSIQCPCQTEVEVLKSCSSWNTSVFYRPHSNERASHLLEYPDLQGNSLFLMDVEFSLQRSLLTVDWKREPDMLFVSIRLMYSQIIVLGTGRKLALTLPISSLGNTCCSFIRGKTAAVPEGKSENK